MPSWFTRHRPPRRVGALLATRRVSRARAADAVLLSAAERCGGDPCRDAHHAAARGTRGAPPRRRGDASSWRAAAALTCHAQGGARRCKRDKTLGIAWCDAFSTSHTRWPEEGQGCADSCSACATRALNMQQPVCHGETAVQQRASRAGKRMAFRAASHAVPAALYCRPGHAGPAATVLAAQPHAVVAANWPLF